MGKFQEQRAFDVFFLYISSRVKWETSEKVARNLEQKQLW